MDKGYNSGAYARKLGLHEEIRTAIALESTGAKAAMNAGTSGAFMKRVQIAPGLELLAKAAIDGFDIMSASAALADDLSLSGATKVASLSVVADPQYGAKIHIITDRGHEAVGYVKNANGQLPVIKKTFEDFVANYNNRDNQEPI
jgi:hypothetical protein